VRKPKTHPRAWRWLPMWLLWGALTIPLRAADPAWSLRVWQTDEGLPDNAVVGIGQTQDGLLWVATQAGLVRFDGLQMQNYYPATEAGVPTGLMRTLYVDREDRVWLPKDLSTLVCLAGERTLALTTRDGLPAMRAKSIAEDGEGNLWIAYAGRLVLRIHNQERRVFTPDDGLPGPGDCQLACSRNGRLWYLSNGKVGTFRDNRFVPAFDLPGAQGIAPARAGGCWLSGGARLSRGSEDGTCVEIARLPTRDAVLTARVLLEDRTGAVWIGTTEAGLFRFDGTHFQSVATSRPEILCLYEDREGSLWVGTMGGGLNLIRPSAVEVQDPAAGASLPGVQSICEDKEGNLWAVNRDGSVAVNRGSGWHILSVAEDWTLTEASCVEADPGGGIWVGTHNGQLRRWRGSWDLAFTRTNGLGGQIIRSLAAAPNGDLWVGPIGGNLQRLRGGSFRTFELPSGSGTVRALAVDASGTCWAGMSSGALLRVRGDQVESEPAVAGALSQAIRCLTATADGSLWIGYSGTGVGWLRSGRFNQFRSTEGLPDENISQIVEDAYGWLWLAGNRGLFRARKSDFQAVADGRSEQVRPVVYGRDEGLPSLQASWYFWPGSVRRRDGSFCVALQTGLAIVHPDAPASTGAPAPVLLQSVLVDGREVAAYDRQLVRASTNAQDLLSLRQPNPQVRVPPDHQQVSFSFTAPTFRSPRNAAFRYRLAGLDRDWVEAGARRIAYYTHIPPGSYQFQVAARAEDGNWNPVAGTVALVSEPHFWQTAWFRATALLAAVGGLGGAGYLTSRRRYRRKLQRLEQRQALERERARIAQDLHDDLGAGLAEISFGSALAQDPGLSPDEAREHTREIGTRARELVTALDEIVWAVNPKHDTVVSLAAYFCQYAQHFLKATPVHCHLDVARDLPVAPLNAEQRHRLFLAFKEALSNVVQHAGATDLRLTIGSKDDLLTVRISDNGRGLDPRAAPARFGADGLDNMRQRLQQLGGSCAITGGAGEGTTVIFQVPLRRPGITGEP